MKHKLGLFGLFAIGSMMIQSAIADDHLPKASKHENASWYEMLLIKFKPGKEWAANEFIKEHWVVVDAEVGRANVGYDFEFGKWDQMVLFPIADPADIAWDMTPGDETWFAAFVEHAGGMDEAVKLLDEWNALVDETETFLVRHRGD